MRMTRQMQAALYWARRRRLEVGDVGFDASSEALFARMTVQPNDARKELIDDVIRGLKMDGVWVKLDALYDIAAHDSQAGQRNWIANQYNLTPVGSPVFTVDRGYAGDGVGAYLDTGFNPTTAVSPKFIQNSGHISARNRAAHAGSDTSLMGSRSSTTNYINIIPRSAAGSAIGRVNSGSNAISVVAADSVGDYLVNRSASNALQGYKNGVQLTTSSAVSVTPPNANIMLLARGVAGAGPDTFSIDQVASASIGGSLTEAEAIALYSRLRTYMIAVGAA